MINIHGKFKDLAKDVLTVHSRLPNLIKKIFKHDIVKYKIEESNISELPNVSYRNVLVFLRKTKNLKENHLGDEIVKELFESYAQILKCEIKLTNILNKLN